MIFEAISLLIEIIAFGFFCAAIGAFQLIPEALA
jgi:hypothetical protein